jgi:hypothetical protein
MLTDCELNISLDPFSLCRKINNKMINNKSISNFFKQIIYCRVRFLLIYEKKDIFIIIKSMHNHIHHCFTN